MRFANIAAGNQFTTAELYPHTLDALGCQSADYSLRHCGTIFPSFERRIWLRRSRIPAVIASCRKAIPSVLSFSNYSRGSMRRLQRDYYSPFAVTPNSASRNDRNLIGFISESSMIWINSLTPSD